MIAMAKNRSKTQSKSAGRNGIVVDSDRRKFRWQSWLLAMMVGAMAFAVFFPAMRNDFVDWDDTDNFIRNQYIRGLSWENIQWMFSTFHMGHFQPLTWLTIGFDSVWGGWAFGPHVVHATGWTRVHFI